MQAGTRMIEWSTYSSLLSATQWGAENSDRYKGSLMQNDECTYTHNNQVLSSCTISAKHEY